MRTIRNPKVRTTRADANNKTMNNETYMERANVMQYIYNAKHLLRSIGVNMPRIRVRISSKVAYLGQAQLSANNIWINADYMKGFDKVMQQIVFHELVHTLTGFKHDNDCKLMKPTINPNDVMPISELNKLFLGYFK